MFSFEVVQFVPHLPQLSLKLRYSTLIMIAKNSHEVSTCIIATTGLPHNPRVDLERIARYLLSPTEENTCMHNTPQVTYKYM